MADLHDPLIGVTELYDRVMDLCEQEDLEMADALTALTIAIRDLALHQHGPDRAKVLSVLALEQAFDLMGTSIASGTCH